MRRYIVSIGELDRFHVTAKNARAVVNRYITEPDQVAIVREPLDDNGRFVLWRVGRTGQTERIGWIEEAEE